MPNQFTSYLRAMNFRVNWDAMGVAASLACAIHCAILPLLLTSLPVLGINIIENEAFEYFMILVAFGIGAYSFSPWSTKHHHSTLPIIIFAVGITGLIAKQIWHQYQFWILPFAVLFIVTAHLINFRACRVHATMPMKTIVTE